MVLSPYPQLVWDVSWVTQTITPMNGLITAASSGAQSLFSRFSPCPEHAVDHELPYLMEAAKKVFVAKLTEYLEREMEHTLGKMWYESKRR